MLGQTTTTGTFPVDLYRRTVKPVPVKQLTGYEGERWRGVIPCLRRGRHYVTNRAVAGDAPKDFIHVYEYGTGRRSEPKTWPAYVAKVGHKWYPAESITEHLMTRIGQMLGLRMATSRLMLCANQIRFMSRYFLQGDDSLVHGAEIVAGYVEDDKFVADVERQQLEKEIFTFQVLRVAIETRFPMDREPIVSGFARMLAFDALVGNQDRHLYNWGVIVHPKARRTPEFSPIYDTARGLFWNTSEAGLAKYLDEAALLKYVEAARPLVGCDGDKDANHFRLIAKIAETDSDIREVLRELGSRDAVREIGGMIDGEFSRLLSAARRALIKRCLEIRFAKYSDALGGGSVC
jgi:hypothetical protein